MSENLISIQQYAIKHKLSTFATVKLIHQGKIKTIKKVVDNEEREWVIDDTPHTQSGEANALKTTASSATLDYEAKYNELLAKYSVLQEKYTTLLETYNAKK